MAVIAMFGMAHNQFDTLRIFQTGIYGAKAAFCTLMPIYGSEKPASA